MSAWTVEDDGGHLGGGGREDDFRPGIGPHFVRRTGDLTVTMYLDGCEWMIAVSGLHHNVASVVHLRDVIAEAPEMRDEAVGMMRSVLRREETALRARMKEAEHALDAANYAGANALLDDLRAWPVDDAARELQSVGEPGS